MRVIHTSDWHVGRTLHRIQRLDETRASLQEIAQIAEREQVDVLVVCGDIFEHQSPSAEAEQVVYEALEQFCDQGLSIVLITGNHDNPKRWRALAPLLRRFNVFVADDLRPPSDGGVIDVPSRDGKEIVQVAAVPWVSERRSYTAADLMGLSERSYQSYADEMSRAIHAVCDGFEPGKCHLLAAHVFISGSVVSESERSLTIGEIYAVTPNAIPATVQYAALGHVHKPQKPPGVSPPARYSGSLLQLDFGEAGQRKSVALIDLAPNKPAQVKEIPLAAGRKLVDVSATLDALDPSKYDLDGSYLRVKLTCDGPQPGLSDQVRELLPNALVVQLDYPKNETLESMEVRSKSPRELFEGYLTGRYPGEQPSAELLSLFDELLDESADAGRTGQLTLEVDAADLTALSDTADDEPRLSGTAEELEPVAVTALGRS